LQKSKLAKFGAELFARKGQFVVLPSSHWLSDYGMGMFLQMRRKRSPASGCALM
jgi:hypothetical protein